MAKTTDESLFSAGEYKVEEVCDLNFCALLGAKGVKGTSNKSFHMERWDGNNGKAQIFTMYGPTGGTQQKDYRHYDSIEEARKEFSSIKRSKERKGYQEVKLAIRAIGSDEAKKIVSNVQLKNIDIKPNPDSNKLHKETSRLISVLMGSTNKFVVDTFKCPLGQLTNEQIDKGNNILNEAQIVVENHSKDKSKIVELSNSYYSNIPYNLGSGARGKLENLLLDSIDKINQKRYDLDTLLDAKAIGATLVSDNTYDQYKSLDTEIEYIERESDLFKWINRMVLETYSNTHRHLGKLNVLNVWDVSRNNERNIFLNRAKEIAKECGKQTSPNILKNLVKDRNDVWDKDLFYNANILPLFHGTRTQNISGLLKKGLLIKPPGVVLCGDFYGSGLYFADIGTKSINYTSIKGSYWAHGTDKKAYLFITDCTLGNQKVISSSHKYTKNNIKPCHSVWAKGYKDGGTSSSLINNEYVVYDINQHNIRYIIEFTTSNAI